MTMMRRQVVVMTSRSQCMFSKLAHDGTLRSKGSLPSWCGYELPRLMFDHQVQKQWFSSSAPSRGQMDDEYLDKGSTSEKDKVADEIQYDFSADRAQLTQIKLLQDKKTLQLQFKVPNRATEQFCCTLPAELLRVESPSAEVTGHGSTTKRLISGKKFVTITGIERVGNYAVRITFSDEHSTGIYTWNYLYGMCRQKYSLMKQYIHRLKAGNKSRYPMSYLRKMKEEAAKDNEEQKIKQ